MSTVVVKSPRKSSRGRRGWKLWLPLMDTTGCGLETNYRRLDDWPGWGDWWDVLMQLSQKRLVSRGQESHWGSGYGGSWTGKSYGVVV